MGVGIALAALLTGCVATAHDSDAHTAASHVGPAASASAPPADAAATATPSPAPPAHTEAPDPAISHPATPDPSGPPAPQPMLTPVLRGTVVAQGDVASPKGSIHFHYRMVADGDNTYTAEYSRFTSTVPIPVSVTLLQIPPKVGDGLTYHGVADHLLGGPTTTAAPASSASLGDVSQPSYLGTLVTYSSVASGKGVPIELGPNKVLAVDTVHWSVPVRHSNVHPTDSGSRAYARGKVTAKTADGAPKSYLVAPGDITSVVAQRFGITVADLIWLNSDLQVFGDQQYLYKGTTLNLDPDSL